jgi:D-glycero-D-manno-heptose 1,7-bisphosphate phosphatase
LYYESKKSIQQVILKDWTIFLDRDGVINKRLPGEYVRTLAQFEFLPEVLTTIQRLSKIFARIIIVTNQQGIGKGLMTEEDLQVIHTYLMATIRREGGVVDAIYVAPDLAESQSQNRKPNIGMALQAKSDFPEIVFKKSIMVGDSLSDLQFGRKAGMTTVFLSSADKKTDLADFYISQLSDLLLSDMLTKASGRFPDTEAGLKL